jgi:hypothetical protein
MRSDFPWLRPVRPHVRPSVRGGRGPQARAVRGRYIVGTKVEALPEWLGQCTLLEYLCVPRPPPPPPCACAAVPAAALLRVALPRRALGPSRAALAAAAAALPVVGRRPSPAHAWLARAADRRAFAVGRSRPARPHGWARRFADNTELAALPAAADWPSLKRL